MQRQFALAALLLGAPIAAAACNGVTVVDVTDYDQTCKADADCVAVKNGDICCGCPNAAINKSDLARYQDDLGTCAAVCEIACVGDAIPVCANGTCGLQTK
jgi:hypothetical protein